MTDAEAAIVIAQYRDAIDKLNAYIADEPSDARRDEAVRRISDYRQKIIDTAWQGLVARTQALERLASDLDSIIANASDTRTLSAALSGLRDTVSSARATLTDLRA